MHLQAKHKFLLSKLFTVSIRMVPLSLRGYLGSAQRQMVLPQMYGEYGAPQESQMNRVDLKKRRKKSDDE